MRKIDVYLGLLYYVYVKAQILTADIQLRQGLGLINEIDAVALATARLNKDVEVYYDE